jgi:adenylate cyclase
MWLIMNPGLLTERVLPPPEGATTIGRTEENSICVLHASLSRRHTRLERTGDQVVLFDQNSKNGTFVNETRVSQCELSPGDSFRCGEVPFKLMAPSEPKPTHVQDLRTRFSPAAMEDLLLQERTPGSSVLKLRQVPTVDSRAAEKLQVLLKAGQMLSSLGPIDELLERPIHLGDTRV